MILHRYSKEKFCLGHLQELKGECQYHSLLQPHTSPYFWPSTANRNINVFFSQPSVAIKIKDGSHNFRQENTEHSLAKIMPALQAWEMKTSALPCFLKEKFRPQQREHEKSHREKIWNISIITTCFENIQINKVSCDQDLVLNSLNPTFLELTSCTSIIKYYPACLLWRESLEI